MKARGRFLICSKNSLNQLYSIAVFNMECRRNILSPCCYKASAQRPHFTWYRNLFLLHSPITRFLRWFLLLFRNKLSSSKVLNSTSRNPVNLLILASFFCFSLKLVKKQEIFGIKEGRMLPVPAFLEITFLFVTPNVKYRIIQAR